MNLCEWIADRVEGFRVDVVFGHVRARDYRRTEITLIGCPGKCVSIKKVGDNVSKKLCIRFSFHFAFPARISFMKRNENSA